MKPQSKGGLKSPPNVNVFDEFTNILIIIIITTANSVTKENKKNPARSRFHPAHKPETEMRARLEVVEDVPVVEVRVREDTVHATAHRTELRDRRFLSKYFRLNYASFALTIL